MVAWDISIALAGATGAEGEQAASAATKIDIVRMNFLIIYPFLSF